MTRRKRNRPNPYGTHARSRALTDQFGPKPNWMTWKAFHYLADHEPDKLRATLARYSTRAAVLEGGPR